LAAISPPAFARRFSEVKAHPGLLYFQVWAQRSCLLKVPEPITLFRMPLIMLLPAELLLLEFPPSTAPKIPATAEPALLVALVDVAALLVVVAAVVVAEVVVAAVVLDAAEVVFFVEVFLVVVFLEVFFVVFLAVFLTGIISDIEALSAASFIALALLPAVHASTRAAKRNTFFIAFYIFIFITLIYIYPILPIVLSGAKFAKKSEIR
jgi:hypothetical protein